MSRARDAGATDLAEMIEAMPPEQKAGALAVLDALTRPLTQAEIVALLKAGGVSRARAVKIAAAVAPWHIVALIGDGATS